MRTRHAPVGRGWSPLVTLPSRVRPIAGRRPSSALTYLAYSTARVSRMTVTLIWPG